MPHRRALEELGKKNDSSDSDGPGHGRLEDGEERDIGVCWYLFSHLCTHKCVEQSGGNRGRGAGLTQLPPHGLCQHSARGFILLSFFEELRYTLVISFVCHARALHDRLQP